MKKIMGSVCRGGVEIRGENVDIFKLGPYSYRNMQDRQNLNDQQRKGKKKSNVTIVELW